MSVTVIYMGKHFITLVAAAVLTVLSPGSFTPGHRETARAETTDDIGSSILSRIKPTVPPDAPRICRTANLRTGEPLLQDASGAGSGLRDTAA